MHVFITRPADYPQRPYNLHPLITTAHSAQISTDSLGCKLREFVCVDCVRRMLFIQDNRTTLEYTDLIIHIIRFGLLSDGATPGLGAL